MEKKTTTYGDLKIRKQELRDEGILGVNMEEYLQNMNAIKEAEACLLWGIVWTDIEPERVKPVTRQCRTGAIACFIIAGIAAVILVVALFGCHTVHGIGQDLSMWSSPYIQEK